MSFIWELHGQRQGRNPGLRLKFYKTLKPNVRQKLTLKKMNFRFPNKKTHPVPLRLKEKKKDFWFLSQIVFPQATRGSGLGQNVC